MIERDRRQAVIGYPLTKKLKNTPFAEVCPCHHPVESCPKVVEQTLELLPADFVREISSDTKCSKINNKVE